MCPEACENKAFGKCRKAMRLVSRLHVSYQISIPKLKPKTCNWGFSSCTIVRHKKQLQQLRFPLLSFLSVFKFNIFLLFKSKRARFYIGATKKICSRLKVGKKSCSQQFQFQHITSQAFFNGYQVDSKECYQLADSQLKLKQYVKSFFC